MRAVIKFAKYIIAALLIIILINIFLVNPIHEGLSLPPTNETVTFKLKDTTNSETEKPKYGTFYVFTDANFKLKNTINMNSDSSGVKLLFDSSNVTNIIICPVNTKDEPAKFPKMFTIDYKFTDLSKNYKLLNQDVSANVPTNSMKKYVSPGGDISGNFINIAFAKSFGQSLKNMHDDVIGNVTLDNKNGFNIEFNNASEVDGILIAYNAPTIKNTT